MQGDEAFTALWQREHDGLYRALALTLGDRDLASEAVDEGFARAYARWTHVQGLADPAGWIYRVAMNWATSWLRKRLRRPTRPIEDLDRAVRDPGARRGARDRRQPPPAPPTIRRGAAVLPRLARRPDRVVARRAVGNGEEPAAPGPRCAARAGGGAGMNVQDLLQDELGRAAATLPEHRGDLDTVKRRGRRRRTGRQVVVCLLLWRHWRPSGCSSTR